MSEVWLYLNCWLYYLVLGPPTIGNFKKRFLDLKIKEKNKKNWQFSQKTFKKQTNSSPLYNFQLFFSYLIKNHLKIFSYIKLIFLLFLYFLIEKMKKKIRKGRPHIYFLIASFVEKKIPPQFPSKSNFTLMAPIFICPQQILRKFVVMDRQGWK